MTSVQILESEHRLIEADNQELSEPFAAVDRKRGLAVIARLEEFARSLAPVAAQASVSNAAPPGTCACEDSK